MPTGLGGEQLWLCPTINNSTDDISGNGNNGTFSGMSINNDADGKHYYQGSSDSDSLTGTFSTPFAVRSISFWVSSSFTGSSSFHMLDSVSGSNKFSDNRWNKRYRVVVDGVAGNYATTYINQNVWHHVVLTYDPNSQTSSIYINGVLDGQTTGVTGTTTTDSYEIGAVLIYSRYDDLRAYDRVLTQGEIKHLSSKRGVLGSPPKGLGDEQLWLCPSLQDSANDLSNSNNHGTYNGGMGTVADTAEGGSLAYDLNGTTQYITLGNVLTGTGDFTISGWFNTDSTSFSYIYGKGVEGPSADGIGIAQEANAVYGAIGSSSGRTVLANAGTTTISTWYHYAVTFDRDGVATKYLNGVQVGTDSISSKSGDIGTDTDYVGRYGSASQGFFDGKLDDIRAYNRVLTQSEITHLATARGVEGNPFKGLGDEQLWLCPSLNDSSSDLSSNSASISYFNGLATTADTTSGGARAYDFDAGNVGVDCGDILDSTVWATGNPFTISGWAKVGSDGVVVLSKLADTVNMTPTGSNNREWIVQVRDRGSGMKAEVTYYPVAQNRYRLFDTNSTLSVGTWYHFAFIYNGPTATNADPEIYIDGVSQALTLSATNGADDGAMADLSASVASGLMLEGANYGLPRGGRTDDIRAYNRVLTQAEITHLATSRGVLGSPGATTQYNAFLTHAFKQLFQTRLR